LAIIFAAIRLSSRGPVFYGQTRIGRNNSTFTAWKFRSMFANADEVLLSQLEKNPKLRSEWERDHKLKNDPRITPVGRLLRKTSLDELPQLWNVFRGDMSLVGPRPIVAAEIARYSDVFEAYKSVRPGITGMWQVSGRNNTTYLERIRFDEYYVRNWSVWLDLYILVRTFKTVLFGEGAY
jgi:Undecaprenyl-phosphate galactose phosphotransferase WbaP